MTNLKQKLNNELSDELSNDVPGEDDFVQDEAAPEQLVQVETVSAPDAPEASPETPQNVAQNAAGAAAEVQEDFQPLHLRRRLRELLSIPERDRNDAQWDEIIELEIQLAPGNRVAGHDVGGGNTRQLSGSGWRGGQSPPARAAQQQTGWFERAAWWTTGRRGQCRRRGGAAEEASATQQEQSTSAPGGRQGRWRGGRLMRSARTSFVPHGCI